LDANDFDNAVVSFEKAEQLNVKMPETFYYHFGKAYSGAKKMGQGQNSLRKIFAASRHQREILS
jgi:hypothetical protein